MRSRSFDVSVLRGEEWVTAGPVRAATREEAAHAARQRWSGTLKVEPQARTPDLSFTQEAAIRAIVEAYDTAIAGERARWGEASAASVAAHGIDPALIVKSYRTLHALEDRGMITRKSQTRVFGERLRKGAWGRRLGGTVTDRYSQHMVVPTPIARAYLAEQLAPRPDAQGLARRQR
jgi:hypothetical protein